LEGGYETVFKYLGKDVIYRPTCDLSLRNKRLGTWTDRYYFDSKSIDFSLQTRLYENIDEIAPFIKDTNLIISETVADYRRQDIYPGWLEFTLTKK
jgi:hypothetical protein